MRTIPLYFYSILLARVGLTRIVPRRHVKALESRSQLLDAALASADEANRRWEDCRALVDQLRIENAALRAALSQAQMVNGQAPTLPPPPPGIDQVLASKDDAPNGNTETSAGQEQQESGETNNTANTASA